MAAGANATLLTNLVDPEVLAGFIDKKLVDAIRLSPLARIDDTLVGRPGDEISLPSYAYIGDAVSVNEGADIPIAKLTTSVEKVKVAKIGKAVEISDEAILAGYGSVVDEASSQILTAINSGVESSLLNAMATTATQTDTVAADADAADAIADALVKFGEDIDGEKVIVIPASFYARLRKTKSWIPNTEIGAKMIVQGVVGMVHGCQVVVSNRMSVNNQGVITNSAYIVKPGALAIYHKRNTLVEFDRDILAEMNYIKGSNIFAPYVYDKSKLIKLSLANPS